MVNQNELEILQDFFADNDIDESWLLSHLSIELISNRTVVITIDKINCQEYGWLEDAKTPPHKER